MCVYVSVCVRTCVFQSFITEMKFKFKHYITSITQLKKLNMLSKARVLAFCGLLGGRTRRKPPNLDGWPLPCHMPTPGIEPSRSSGKRGIYPCANQALEMKVSLPHKIQAPRKNSQQDSFRFAMMRLGFEPIIEPRHEKTCFRSCPTM